MLPTLLADNMIPNEDRTGHGAARIGPAAHGQLSTQGRALLGVPYHSLKH